MSNQDQQELVEWVLIYLWPGLMVLVLYESNPNPLWRSGLQTNSQE